MTDAAEVAAESLHWRARGGPIEGPLNFIAERDRERHRQTARAVLSDLHAAGWRIVRTVDSGAYDPPDDFDFTADGVRGTAWDRSGVFYEDEDRPEGCVPLVRVEHEWTP